MRRTLLLAGLAVGAFGFTYLVTAVDWQHSLAAPPGMRWVPGGEFTMGNNDANVSPAEGPAHRVRVDGFWMDETDVTNAQFRAFVEATGYRTTAEKAPTLEEIVALAPRGAPPPKKEDLVPGSLVFTPPDHPVPLDDV